MAILNKTGITDGTTIQAEHITRTIDALTGVSTDTIAATGSFTGSFAGNVSITDTTTGTGPYYIAFTSAATGNQQLRVDSTGLLFNATTNIIAATASVATTASYAVSSEKDWMTLRLSTGLITGVTSGSIIYVGIGGVTGSVINRIGLMLPAYSCSIVSASVYCNAPVATNTILGPVRLMYDVTGSLPVTASNLSSLDPQTKFLDANSTAVNLLAAPNKWINLAFTPNATVTGQFVISADVVIKKL